VPRSELPPTEFVADDAKMLSMAIACQCLLPSPLLDDRVVRSKQDLCHLSTQTCRIVLRLCQATIGHIKTFAQPVASSVVSGWRCHCWKRTGKAIPCCNHWFRKI